jgi:hypothetical protein
MQPPFSQDRQDVLNALANHALRMRAEIDNMVQSVEYELEDLLSHLVRMRARINILDVEVNRIRAAEPTKEVPPVKPCGIDQIPPG